MTLRETINQDIKNAMKAKETKKRDALRLLTSACKQIEVDERKELSDADVIQIIQKQVKSRKDSITQYKDAGRDELAQIEQDEIDIYMKYMPAQLDNEELSFLIHDIILKVGATSIKDLGKVMSVASKELAGRVDGKRISECVKKLLG